MFGNCTVRVQFVGVMVYESCNVWEWQCVGVEMFWSCSVWEFQCIRIVKCASSRVRRFYDWELHCVRVVACAGSSERKLWFGEIGLREFYNIWEAPIGSCRLWEVPCLEVALTLSFIM